MEEKKHIHIRIDGSEVAKVVNKHVEAGRKGAATRWGAPRVIRMDKLTDVQRRLVVVLIELLEEANRK